MIQGFKKTTKDLSKYEKEILLPIIAERLRYADGKNLAVTNREMCRELKGLGYDAKEARVRKIINHIRITGLIPCLIANGKGYFTSGNSRETEQYITSLTQRAKAISAVADALKKQLEEHRRRTGKTPEKA